MIEDRQHNVLTTPSRFGPGSAPVSSGSCRRRPRLAVQLWPCGEKRSVLLAGGGGSLPARQSRYQGGLLRHGTFRARDSCCGNRRRDPLVPGSETLIGASDGSKRTEHGATLLLNHAKPASSKLCSLDEQHGDNENRQARCRSSIKHSSKEEC
jgi:hypothetical protein